MIHAYLRNIKINQNSKGLLYRLVTSRDPAGADIKRTRQKSANDRRHLCVQIKLNCGSALEEMRIVRDEIGPSGKGGRSVWSRACRWWKNRMPRSGCLPNHKYEVIIGQAYKNVSVRGAPAHALALEFGRRQ
jgi:hypothetical protein